MSLEGLQIRYIGAFELILVKWRSSIDESVSQLRIAFDG